MNKSHKCTRWSKLSYKQFSKSIRWLGRANMYGKTVSCAWACGSKGSVIKRRPPSRRIERGCFTYLDRVTIGAPNRIVPVPLEKFHFSCKSHPEPDAFLNEECDAFISEKCSWLFLIWHSVRKMEVSSSNACAPWLTIKLIIITIIKPLCSVAEEE